jgi:hypothetical protein
MCTTPTERAANEPSLLDFAALRVRVQTYCLRNVERPRCRKRAGLMSRFCEKGDAPLGSLPPALCPAEQRAGSRSFASSAGAARPWTGPALDAPLPCFGAFPAETWLSQRSRGRPRLDRTKWLPCSVGMGADLLASAGETARCGTTTINVPTPAGAANERDLASPTSAATCAPWRPEPPGRHQAACPCPGTAGTPAAWDGPDYPRRCARRARAAIAGCSAG